MSVFRNASVETLPWWRQKGTWICFGLLIVYAVAIVLDLPTPAGARYQQNLPASELVKWGTTPVQSAQQAAHWWDKTQGLRGWSANPEGWFWPKIVPAPLPRWLALFALGLLGAAGLWWLERRSNQQGRRVRTLGLISIIVFAYVFQLATLWLKSSNPEQMLLDRIVDRDFTGYFTSALKIDDSAAFFSAYDATIRSPAYCAHCQTHPPGPVLFYWLLLNGVNHLPPRWQVSIAQSIEGIDSLSPPNLSPAAIIVAWVAGNLILLAAAAIAIPLYGLARQLSGPELALPLTALGAALPGLILMSPEFDQLYATLAAGVLYLGLRGLATPRHNGWWGLSSGLIFAFCLYWALGPSVLIMPIMLMACLAVTVGVSNYAMKTADSPPRLSIHAAMNWLLGFGLGVAIPWIVLWSLLGFDVPGFIRAVHDHLKGIMAIRPYGPWVVFNLVDYLQFVGLPVVLATVLTLTTQRSAVGRLSQSRSATQMPVVRLREAATRLGMRLNFYGVLFWFVVLALDLSGMTRGEVGRLWVFLTPLALLAVFHAAGRGQLKASHIHALLAAQFLACLLIGGNWLTP